MYIHICDKKWLIFINSLIYLLIFINNVPNDYSYINFIIIIQINTRTLGLINFVILSAKDVTIKLNVK